MFRNDIFPAFYRLLATLALCLLPLSSVSAKSNSDYIRMSDYLAQHPDQKAVIGSFSERVRQPGKPLSTQQTRPVRISIIYPALQASDYWTRSVTSFEARLKESGILYELKLFQSRPSVDVTLQSQQLNEALEWQPDYLIFTLDALRHQRMIQRVLSRGTPKLILQNITTPLKQWQQHRPFMYVGFDHAEGTRLIGNKLLAMNDYSGRYLMLYFSHGYVSAMRGDTFAMMAAEHPSVVQSASFYTDGNRERAREAVKRALSTDPDLKFIFASATDIALGAIDALRSTNRLGDIPVNGWGGGSAELEALANGDLALTVMRMNDDNGAAMAEAIRLDLEGSESAVPHVYSGSIELIDQDTSAAGIEALKARAFRYSGH